MSLTLTENWEVLASGSDSKIVEESSLITVIKITIFFSSPAVQRLEILLYYLESLHGILSNEKFRPTV